MRTNYPLGWFAARSEDRKGPNGESLWEACLQVPGAIFTLADIWFTSKEDCLDFICEDVLGKGLIEELKPSGEPSPDVKEYFDKLLPLIEERLGRPIGEPNDG